MTQEQEDAIDEFRQCANMYLKSLSREELSGTRYALEMAAAECGILGVDPGKITPDGYVGDNTDASDEK